MAHLPNTRPSGLVMPSMASSEPFGFAPRSIDGTPDSSTYCVAIWPLALSCASTSSEATKRPSPWEMATVYTSPTAVLASHGERFEATRVRTRRLGDGRSC